MRNASKTFEFEEIEIHITYNDSGNSPLRIRESPPGEDSSSVSRKLDNILFHDDLILEDEDPGFETDCTTESSIIFNKMHETNLQVIDNVKENLEPKEQEEENIETKENFNKINFDDNKSEEEIIIDSEDSISSSFEDEEEEEERYNEREPSLEYDDSSALLETDHSSSELESLRTSEIEPLGSDESEIDDSFTTDDEKEINNVVEPPTINKSTRALSFHHQNSVAFIEPQNSPRNVQNKKPKTFETYPMSTTPKSIALTKNTSSNHNVITSPQNIKPTSSSQNNLEQSDTPSDIFDNCDDNSSVELKLNENKPNPQFKHLDSGSDRNKSGEDSGSGADSQSSQNVKKVTPPIEKKPKRIKNRILIADFDESSETSDSQEYMSPEAFKKCSTYAHLTRFSTNTNLNQNKAPTLQRNMTYATGSNKLVTPPRMQHNRENESSQPGDSCSHGYSRSRSPNSELASKLAQQRPSMQTYKSFALPFYGSTTSTQIVVE